MTGSTHVVITIAATLVYTISTGQAPDAASWFTVVLGGLAPDIDGGRATVARPGTLLAGLLPRWLVRLLDFMGLTVSGSVRRLVGHRNMIHWPVWAVGWMLLGHYFGLGWLWWFGFGYLGHILADFCTKSGVPLAGPISTKDIRWSPLKTGSWPESVIATVLWGFIFWQGSELAAGQARHWVSQVTHTVLIVIS